MTKVYTPWTDDQVKNLNRYQQSGQFHPFTCGNDSRHADLHATTEGWVCYNCEYVQDWAHEFMTQDLRKRQLLELVKVISYRVGDFVLASGKMSNIFFDMKPTLLNPTGIKLISDLIIDKIGDEYVTAIGGQVLGACPIVSAVVTKSSNISGFYIRKEIKDHGTKKLIEGYNVKCLDKVVLVEDVSTTGESLIQSLKAMNDIGAQVVKIITVVDREQGASERLAKEGYVLESLIKRSELE